MAMIQCLKSEITHQSIIGATPEVIESGTIGTVSGTAIETAIAHHAVSRDLVHHLSQGTTGLRTASTGVSTVADERAAVATIEAIVTIGIAVSVTAASGTVETETMVDEAASKFQRAEADAMQMSAPVANLHFSHQQLRKERMESCETPRKSLAIFSH